MKISACVSLTALAAVGALSVPVAAQQIGTVGAVNRDMLGTPPGADPRDLGLGMDVVHDERVETSEIGSGQLVFVDQTTLTVAPNSDIVLDEYVYDPAGGGDAIALRMTKGALRFIGGRITKSAPGLIHLPTATVGVRGGLAVMTVDASGTSEIIHLAGEFTTVTQYHDADGDGVDDGPASGRAARSSVVLSRPGASAMAESEGVEFTGLASRERLAQIYGELEGEGSGGLEAAPSETTVADGTTTVAEVNSEVPGGETREPVSTSGEQPVPPSGTAEQTQEPHTEVQTSVGTPPPPPPPAGLPLTAPAGGAVFTPATGFVPFDTVTVGSLIGSGGSETIRFPVPASSENLLIDHPEGAEFDLFAVDLVNRQAGTKAAGYFTFTADTATSSTLGGLEGEFSTTGFGFSDFLNEFHFAPFVAPGQGVDGIALFGTPTPDQARFFAGDTNTAGANTVDVYVNEFGIDLNRSFLSTLFDPGRFGAPDRLFLVGNSGEARFDTGAQPTGRLFGGHLRISDDGGREERFALFVEPIRTLDGNPSVSGSGFVTTNVPGHYSFAEPNYGTFEDGAGHVFFGPDANYFALSSVHRSRNGALVTNDFGTDEVLLDRASGTVSAEESPFRASLFTRDPASAAIVSDPLLLANDTTSRVLDPRTEAPATGMFDGGFAAGIAICSSGHCGEFTNDAGDTLLTGAYPLISVAGDNVEIRFEGHSEPGVDTNGLQAEFWLTDLGLSEIASGSDSPEVFALGIGPNGVAAGDNYGAYIDDDRFAAVGSGTQTIAGVQQFGKFNLASTGLVGVGDPGLLFDGATDTTPEYLRWGWWSATYEVSDVTGPRTDLVPLGTFVAGNQPNLNDLPPSGVAEYAGFAAGTMADHASQTTQAIGGNFALEFDFGRRLGTFDLTLQNFGSHRLPVGGSPGANVYAGRVETGSTSATVHGGFFAGGGNPAAATAGSFNISDSLTSRAAIGVFGGDQTSFTPGSSTAQ